MEMDSTAYVVEEPTLQYRTDRGSFAMIGEGKWVLYRTP